MGGAPIAALLAVLTAVAALVLDIAQAPSVAAAVESAENSESERAAVEPQAVRR